ncbi:unnamed protein product [Bursaphelenchus okinawaensis]|uniref:Uncharacterized protein n=1 Tax=Bursaphelenchus okinawaensis TaxID=465554 RepID=A0A811LKR9_9BILA|nr:unnamed protein product [Bursaphelenchus okinawaensis]CAG9125106.1 unnamed protein product [Bursaphelenchus okinawaensis]
MNTTLLVTICIVLMTLVSTQSVDSSPDFPNISSEKWEDETENDYLNNLKSLEHEEGSKLRQMVENYVKAHLASHKNGKEFCAKPLKVKNIMQES